MSYVLNSKDYREILNQIYLKRKKLNASYSLRAFARDLTISASALNEVLNRRHTLSLKSADKILPKLNLSVYESNLFRTMVCEELFMPKNSDMPVNPGRDIFLWVDPGQKEQMIKEIQHFADHLVKSYAPKNEGEPLQICKTFYDFLKTASNDTRLDKSLLDNAT